MKRKLLLLCMGIALLGSNTTFHTASAQCADVTLPWLETFAGGTSCWYKPAGSRWNDVIPYGDPSYEHMRYLYLQMQNDNQGSWIMSPGIQIPADTVTRPILTWKVASNRSDYALHYEVMVTTSANYTDTANYTRIYLDNVTHNQWSAYQQLSVVLQQYCGQTIHIAFHNLPNCAPNADRCVCIDDVEIHATTMPVVDLQAWGNIPVGQATVVRAHLTEGSPLGLSFTWHSTLLNSTWVTADESTSLTYPAVGRDTLSVVVTNAYGTDSASAVLNVVDCDTVTLPLTQDFNDNSLLNTLPSCWFANWQGDNAAYGPHVTSTSGYSYISGLNSNALLMLAGNSIGYASQADVMLPPIANLLPNLAIAFDYTFESADKGTLEVGYFDYTGFVSVKTIAQHTGSLVRDTVRFANITSPNGQIVFRWNCSQVYYGVAIDNIAVWQDTVVTQDSVPWITMSSTANSAMGLRDTVEFRAAMLVGDSTGLAWTWHHTLPCTTLGGGEQQRVVYTAVGIDTAMVIATNSHGSDTVTACVSVYGAPTVAIEGVNSTLSHELITLTASITDGYSEGVTYTWNSTMVAAGKAIVQTDSNLIAILYTAAGTDAVSVVACNGLGCDATMQRVLVVANPNVQDTMWHTVTVMASPAEACVTYGSGRYTEDSTAVIGFTINDPQPGSGHWRFNGWNDGDTTNPRSIVVASDTAFAALFSWVEDSVGVEEVEGGKINVEIYPNPASSDVTVRVSEPSTLSVVDMTGRIVIPSTIINSTFNIPHSSLSTGTYFVRIATDTASTTAKLLVL